MRRQCLGILAAIVPLTFLTAGCSPSGAKAPVQCASEERIPLNCESEFKYDGRTIEGGFSALGIGDANAKTDEVALRQIDKETEQYAASSRRLCDEYNSCVLDKETYAMRSENLRRRMAKVPELYDVLKAAGSPEARRLALADAYRELVPDGSRTELSLELSIEAKKPGERSFAPIAPDTSLPTDTRVAFSVRLSHPAHVYLFQKGPDGTLNVLFPDARIAARNPIQADGILRIPEGSASYRLNEKDIGTERVYVVASLQPLANLASAAEQVAAGNKPTGGLAQVADLDDSSPSAECNQRALEFDDETTPSCVRPRGLELDPEPNSSPASLRAQTEAADSVLVQVFSFEHTR